MSIQDIKDYINRTLPDRTKASDPMYKAGIVREVLFKVLDFASSVIDFYAPNGDGATITTYNRPGEGFMRFMANLVPGSSDFAIVNVNQASRGFTFWRSKPGVKALQLLAAFIDGRLGIGTYEPGEVVEVVGRIKCFGLVAAGGAPIPTAGPGIPSGSVSLGPNSTDQDGLLMIQTGANPVNNQAIARLTLSVALTRTPVGILLTPANDTAAQYFTKVCIYATSASSIVLDTANAGALPANSQLLFYYKITG